MSGPFHIWDQEEFGHVSPLNTERVHIVHASRHPVLLRSFSFSARNAASSWSAVEPSNLQNRDLDGHSLVAPLYPQGGWAHVGLGRPANTTRSARRTPNTSPNSGACLARILMPLTLRPLSHTQKKHGASTSCTAEDMVEPVEALEDQSGEASAAWRDWRNCGGSGMAPAPRLLRVERLEPS